MIDGTCEVCKFVLISGVKPDLTREFLCHRYPPTAVAVTNNQGQMMQLSFFPPTQKTHVCGEFVAKEKLLH